MSGQEILDLTHTDVHAAADHDVLGPAGDPHVAVLVHPAEIPGEGVAVGGEQLGGLLGIVEIPEHVHGALVATSPSSPRGTSLPSSSTILTDCNGSGRPSEVSDRSGSSSTVHMVVVTFSERPYRLSTCRPGNNSAAFVTKLAGIGAPAATHNRMVPMSCTAGS